MGIQIFFVIFVRLDRKGQRIELRCDLHDVGAICGGRLQHLVEPLFEPEAVGEHEIRWLQRRHLLRRGLIVVGVGADGEQDLHRAQIADDGRRQVAEDGRRGDHAEAVGRGLAGGAVAASRSTEGNEQDRRQQGPGPTRPPRSQLDSRNENQSHRHPPM